MKLSLNLCGDYAHKLQFATEYQACPQWAQFSSMYFFFFAQQPHRFQAMLNMKPRCTLIIGHAIKKIFNQCTK